MSKNTENKGINMNQEKAKRGGQILRDCPQCSNSFSVTKYFPVFCSDQCEERFLDYAPTKLIDRVYREAGVDSFSKFQ